MDEATRSASASEPATITSPYSPDVEQLRAWMTQMLSAMKFTQIIAAVIALIVRMTAINMELTKRLSQLRRAKPKSETLARVESQMRLPFEEPASKPGKPKEKKPAQSRRGKHPGRAALPAHLERVIVENPVPADKRICPQCGSEMTTVGHSVCEILDVIPARLIVVQRRDERVACPHDDAIVSAPTPNQLVERGKLGTTLIVESMCDKYIEHLPIERQCLAWERTGVDVAPQTLGRSVAVAIDLLDPLARLVHDQTRGPGLLATDASGLPVLDRDAPNGIRTGTMWCWVNARWVSFFYSPVGDANSVRQFLGKELCRTVQCDGTTVTNFIERLGGKRPGCWAHARRRFVEAARGGDTLALEGLHKIAELFMVECTSKEEGDTAEQRKARRAEHSTPILNDLRIWATEQRGLIPPKTPLGRALGYLYRQWDRLVLFLRDGRIELTNNRVERELRKLVLGRKNWLFTWEDLGGERTATILTLVGTCVAQDINPRAYLHLVVKLLVDGFPSTRLRELLPHALAAKHPELSIEGRSERRSELEPVD